MALIAATSAGSRAHSRTSWPLLAATCASAVPQAPPPITPILMPFINMALRDDAEARAITVGGMLTAGWAVFSFYPIAVFPVVEAPRWTKGSSVNICFIVGCWVSFLVMQYLYKRSEKRKQEQFVGATSRDEEDSLSDKKPVDDIKEHVEERR